MYLSWILSTTHLCYILSTIHTHSEYMIVASTSGCCAMHFYEEEEVC